MIIQVQKFSPKIGECMYASLFCIEITKLNKGNSRFSIEKNKNEVGKLK